MKDQFNYTACLHVLCVCLATGLLASTGLPAVAQPPPPVIKFLFPAGGQRGQSFELTASGTNLQDASQVRITGKGITGKVVKVINPRNVRVAVSIAADAQLGERDFRLITPNGVSSRVRFFVGELPEIVEKEPNSAAEQAQQLDSLPVVVNGQVQPSDRDLFRFKAKAGQTVVCQADARRLIPYIADAVPGWLEACLTLYDPDGNELASVDRFRLNPDPVLTYTIKKDGDYTIEIRDLIYRGRADFVYRLTVGTLPYITDIFPLGWHDGAEAELRLRGVNLPTNVLKLSLNGNDSPVRFVSLRHNGVSSNALPFAVGGAREAQESEPNDFLAQANQVQLPVSINGRIQQPGDTDYFKFTAKKGQRFITEVQARRVGSPLDSIITLFRSNGQELWEQDDTDMGDPLLTRHADARRDYTFPADGEYFLRIKDVQSKGGQEFAYRLHIIPPQPDYHLRAIPDNPRVGQADSTLIVVKALRKDGFNSQIDLAVQGLPKGFVASNAVIPAGQSQTRLTITAPPDASVAVLTPTIVGTAKNGDQTVIRKAVGAENIMQAFSYKHDVPTKEFLLGVISSGSFTLSTNIPPVQVRELHQGDKIEVVVKASRKGLQEALKRAQAEKTAAEQALAKLKADLAKATAAYNTAEKAARDAQAAVPKAKQAADKAAAAQTNAAKNAAAKRKLANEAKKRADELAKKQPDAPETKKARQAYEEAEKAAKQAEQAAAKAKADADKARSALAAAQKDAAAKRKLANEAKAKRDNLAKQQKPANDRLNAAKKRLDAATKDLKQPIKLSTERLPRGVSLKLANIPGDKQEAKLTLNVTKQAPVGLRTNIIITGTIGSGNQAIAHVAPAIPIAVAAPPPPPKKK